MGAPVWSSWGCPAPRLSPAFWLHTSVRGPELISAIALYLYFHHTLLTCGLRPNLQKSSWPMQFCVSKTTAVTHSPPACSFQGFLLYAMASPKPTYQAYFKLFLLCYSSSSSAHRMPCSLPECLWSPLNLLPASAPPPVSVTCSWHVFPPGQHLSMHALSSLSRATWYPLTCKSKSKGLSTKHEAL